MSETHAGPVQGHPITVPAKRCTRCGRVENEGDHRACQRWLASEEPPRFCAECGRRMKVQIIPTGWAAECSRHGEITGGAGV